MSRMMMSDRDFELAWRLRSDRKDWDSAHQAVLKARVRRALVLKEKMKDLQDAPTYTNWINEVSKTELAKEVKYVYGLIFAEVRG